MPIVDKDLATSEIVGTFSQVPLFAGDADITTEEGIIDTGVLAKYTVLGKITATGKLIALTPGASDGSQIAYGILTQAVDATAADVRAGVYVGGFFNDAALVWPAHASLDTLIERQAAFARTPIHIGTVRL
jgi:hypothetical protein